MLEVTNLLSEKPKFEQFEKSSVLHDRASRSIVGRKLSMHGLIRRNSGARTPMLGAGGAASFNKPVHNIILFEENSQRAIVIQCYFL